MPINRKHLWWPFWALVVMSVLPSASWAGKRHSASEAASRGSVTDWMRGVPHGCRLVTFDLLHGELQALAPKDRVDIMWTYGTSAGRYETTVLAKDIDLLATTPLAITQRDRPLLRVTAALTPRQARRLELAAASGTIGMKATGISARATEGSSAWEVQAIEDRTAPIEADLVASAADPADLERPTLAVPQKASPLGTRGVIAVPVEIKLQP